MTYRLVKKFDDEDIPTILSVYKQPLSRSLSALMKKTIGDI